MSRRHQCAPCLTEHRRRLPRLPLCAGLEVSSLGLGAWSWGDRSRYWQNELDKPSNRTVGSWRASVFPAGRVAQHPARPQPPNSQLAAPTPLPPLLPPLQAYKAMIDSGIDFLDTAEVCVRVGRRAPLAAQVPSPHLWVPPGRQPPAAPRVPASTAFSLIPTFPPPPLLSARVPAFVQVRFWVQRGVRERVHD